MCWKAHPPNLHAEFAKHFGLTDNAANKKDWYKLTDAEAEWYVSEDAVKSTLNAPAGSMVLWDSRTVHTGHGPLKGQKGSAQPHCRIYFYDASTLSHAKRTQDKEDGSSNRTTPPPRTGPRVVSSCSRNFRGHTEHLCRRQQSISLLC